MMGMIYYGLSISGANISDDPYLYMVLMGLMEIPAYSLTGSVVERLGRKPTASVSFFIASVVLILAVILKGQRSSSMISMSRNICFCDIVTNIFIMTQRS